MRFIFLLSALLVFQTAKAADFDERMEKAKQGNATAQFWLGHIYSIGEGVPRNDREAVKWYAKAAAQGNVSAQFQLGLMYDGGRGVPENDAEAVKWYREAAGHGHRTAQSFLGLMYATGEGVPVNVILAYVWWSMAKTQGDTFAEMKINELKPQITRQQIAKAQSLAAKCYESDYKDCD